MNRLPKILRRRAHALGLATERRELPPRRCWCGRPVTARSECGCCCVEHEARAISAATDGGPSLREYLASQGEA